MLVAKMMDPESVDFDPRKGRLGKIRIAGKDVDITGGMSGLATLASRIATGKTYSQGTRKWTEIYGGEEFGGQTGLDLVEQFFEGKLAPAPSLARDLLNAKTFDGQPLTPGSVLTSMFVPITPQTIIKDLQSGNDYWLLTAIAETGGFSTTGTSIRPYGAKWQKVIEEAGKEKTMQMLNDVTERFNERAQKLEGTSRWERANLKERNAMVDKIRAEESDRIFRKYGIK